MKSPPERVFRIRTIFRIVSKPRSISLPEPTDGVSESMPTPENDVSNSLQVH